MSNGRHVEERRRRNPWVWLKSKVGRVGAVIAVTLLGLLMASVAWALIMAQANFTGDTTPGTVALEWEGTGGPATFAEYATPDGVIDNTVPVPAGRTCDITISGGEIDLAVDGIFPGEGCIFEDIQLANNSTVEVGTFTFNYSPDYGDDGSAADVEMYLAYWTGSQYSPIDVTALGNLAASAVFGAGVGADNWVLVVEIPTTTVTNGTPFDVAGSYVEGVTTS